MVYPSFIRTVPSNKDQIQLIVHIIKHFGWNWVAFIGSESAYSLDGFQLFYKLIQSTGICLAYYELLSNKSQLKPIFDKIDMLHVNVIILFLDELKAEEVIAAAIRHKFRAKVWIAGEAWSMYQPLTRLPGIETIGTVIGVTPRVGALPGFTDFIHQSRTGGHAGAGLSDSAVCNQDCETCSSLNPEDIISESTAYSFSVYSAVYTMAMALHNALQCNNSGCDKSRTVYPYMVTTLPCPPCGEALAVATMPLMMEVLVEPFMKRCMLAYVCMLASEINKDLYTLGGNRKELKNCH